MPDYRAGDKYKFLPTGCEVNISSVSSSRVGIEFSSGSSGSLTFADANDNLEAVKPRFRTGYYANNEKILFVYYSDTDTWWYVGSTEEPAWGGRMQEILFDAIVANHTLAPVKLQAIGILR